MQRVFSCLALVILVAWAVNFSIVEAQPEQGNVRYWDPIFNVTS